MAQHLHDPPPDAPPPGAGTRASDRTRLGSTVDSPKDTPGGYRSSPTLRYIHDRERVLGRRFSLHREPAIAAALLVEELGPLGARQWLRRVLEEVGR